METQLVRLTSDVLMKIFIRGSPVAGGSQVWSTETGDVTKIEISGCHNLRPFVRPSDSSLSRALNYQGVGTFCLHQKGTDVLLE